SSDIAAGARPVLNDELRTKLLGEPLTYHARDDVNRLAGGKSDDDPHGPRRIGLRPRDPRHSWERGSACCEMQKLSAVGKFHLLNSAKFSIFQHVAESFRDRLTIELPAFVDQLHPTKRTATASRWRG